MIVTAKTAAKISQMFYCRQPRPFSVQRIVNYYHVVNIGGVKVASPCGICHTVTAIAVTAECEVRQIVCSHSCRRFIVIGFSWPPAPAERLRRGGLLFITGTNRVLSCERIQRSSRLFHPPRGLPVCDTIRSSPFGFAPPISGKRRAFFLCPRLSA